MPDLNNPLVQFVRRNCRARGFDIVRYRPLNALLAHHGINVVLDGGANIGQYATELRRQGFHGRIVSFEPQPAIFQTLQKTASADGNWSAVNIGLGDETADLMINICEVTDNTSLLLPLADPRSRVVGQQKVPVRRLDHIWKDHCRANDKVFLKLDVQGYEKKILMGAEGCLDQIIGIQLEMFIVPMYKDQPDWREMLEFMQRNGFALWKVEPGARDPETGRESEMDGIFFRTGR